MPNKKITALTAITPPPDRTFDGLPFVQGGVTKKISCEDISGFYRVKITIPSADFLTLGTVPILAFPSPGPGYAAQIVKQTGHNIFNSVAYSAGGTLTTKHLSATRPLFIFTYLSAATVDMIEMGVLQVASGPTSTQIIEDEAIYITTFNGVDFTLGDSDIVVDLIIDVIAVP